MMDPKTLAKQLINVTQKPYKWQDLARAAGEATDYDRLKPYPIWQFQTWKVEDRGPLPRCMPLPKRIVRRGARFLFGKGIEISCPNNEDLEHYLRDAWNDNEMPSRCVAMATKGGIEGNVALKFSYDPDCTPALQIQTLSLVDQVRFYWHPHNRYQCLMARVQYKYWDAVKGKWFWYREEWTDEEQVVYKPLDDKTWLQASMSTKQQDQDPDTYSGWEIDTRTANPFGVIPIVHIKNLDTDDIYGEGDLWNLFRVIDDLNLVWFQMRRSNQFDSELNPWLIDLELDEDILSRPLSPGEPVEARSTDEQKQGRVEFPSGGNELRTAMMEYAKQIRKEIEDAAGTVNVSHDEVTNKGNLTQAVLKQLYALLIETTDEKRKSYGQNGIEKFLERVAVALQRIGVPLGVNEANADTFDVQVGWPDHFELTEEEKTAKVGRVSEEVVAGFMPRERAVQMVAQMEGIRDIPQLLEELEQEPKPSETETDPNTGENDTESED